jgi:hypothetical protein
MAVSGAGQNSSDAQNQRPRCPSAFPSPLNGERARVRGGKVRIRLPTPIYFFSKSAVNSEVGRILSCTRQAFGCHPRATTPFRAASIGRMLLLKFGGGHVIIIRPQRLLQRVQHPHHNGNNQARDSEQSHVAEQCRPDARIFSRLDPDHVISLAGEFCK